jgi:hypothetical protein
VRLTDGDDEQCGINPGRHSRRICHGQNRRTIKENNIGLALDIIEQLGRVTGK